jgi:hypothetical protein
VSAQRTDTVLHFDPVRLWLGDSFPGGKTPPLSDYCSKAKKPVQRAYAISDYITNFRIQIPNAIPSASERGATIDLRRCFGPHAFCQPRISLDDSASSATYPAIYFVLMFTVTC